MLICAVHNSNFADKKGLWQVLEIYLVRRKVVDGTNSSIEQTNVTLSNYFNEKHGLSQVCEMFPWMFNNYIDGVVREVYERM